jgi:threonine dehydrogenase-like Zn-dependent dehydrogenase
VIAFDINPAVRERALVLGADYAFDSRDENLKEKVAEATGGRMLDVAFDAAGLKVTFEQALDCLTVGGRLVAVGLSAQEASVGTTAQFGLSQKQVLGHLGYKNVDIETLPRRTGVAWPPRPVAVDQRDHPARGRREGYREAREPRGRSHPDPRQTLTPVSRDRLAGTCRCPAVPSGHGI